MKQANPREKSLFSLLRDVSIYGLGAFAARAVGFVITLILARIFTVSQFGQLEFLYTILTVVTAFATLYTESGMLRYYFEMEERRERGSLVFTQLVFSSFSGVMAAAALFLLAGPLFELFPRLEGGQRLGRYAALVVLSTIWFNHTVIYLRATRRAAAMAAFTVMLPLGHVGLTLLMIFGLGLGVEGVFLARSLAETAGCLIVFIWRRAGYYPRFSWLYLKKMLHFGFPLLPDLFIGMFLAYFTRFFIASAFGAQEMGIYGVASRTAMIVGFLVGALKQAWHPYVIALKDEAEIRVKTVKAFSGYLKIMAVAVIGLAFFSPEVITVLASRRYLAGSGLVGYLALALVLQGASYLLSTPMWMHMKMMRYLAASGIGAAGVVGATLLLVPSYGLIGAAWAQAAGFLLLNLVLIYIGRPLMQINYSPVFLLVLTLLVSAVLQIFAGYVQCWGLGWRILLGLAFGAAAGLWLKNELRELWLAQAARSKKALS